MNRPDARFDVTSLADLEPLFDTPQEAAIVRSATISTPMIGRSSGRRRTHCKDSRRYYRDSPMSAISHPVSKTARLTAAARARETRRPDALFLDLFAEALAGPEGFELMERLEAASRPPGMTGPAENPYVVIRTRFIDDFLAAALSGPIQQVVLVAAGLDTRPFRLTLAESLRWYELDRADVLQVKQQVLDSLGAVPRCRRWPVDVDLERADWGTALVEAGFEPLAPSLWVVEGLLPYLEESAVRELLARISRLAAPGSKLVADFPGQSLLLSPWVRPILEVMQRENAPWRFGTDEPEALFEAHGWRATARRPGEDGVSWGRWPYPVPPRGETQFPQSYIVTADRG
jgi:methyltransferase (TIGR00027 family)